MNTGPKLDPMKLERELENQSLGPFRALLARLLLNAPTDEAIHLEAQKYPNRFFQNLQMAKRAAGYRDTAEIALTVQGKIAEMSDAELRAYVSSLDAPCKMIAQESGEDVSDTDIL
jgi:hypothetical protein